MLSLPNLLTLSRIVAVPLLVAFLWWPDWEGGYGIAFVLYCLMGITDYFDGYLARSSGAVSRLGIFLDPIADKIMVAAVILILVGTRDIAGIHVIAALVILLREIAVSGLREFLSRNSPSGRGRCNSSRSVALSSAARCRTPNGCTMSASSRCGAQPFSR